MKKADILRKLEEMNDTDHMYIVWFDSEEIYSYFYTGSELIALANERLEFDEPITDVDTAIYELCESDDDIHISTLVDDVPSDIQYYRDMTTPLGE